jgi:hypothetical protein
MAEALTEGSAGGLLSSEITSSRVPTTWSDGEGNTCCSVKMRVAERPGGECLSDQINLLKIKEIYDKRGVV